MPTGLLPRSLTTGVGGHWICPTIGLWSRVLHRTPVTLMDIKQWDRDFRRPAWAGTGKAFPCLQKMRASVFFWNLTVFTGTPVSGSTVFIVETSPVVMPVFLLM